MPTRSATARYEGLGKDGNGFVSTQSTVLDDNPYGFGTRFEDQPGTNPEELIAAAHASCFTMALSFALAKAGHQAGTLTTDCKVTVVPKDGGFEITKSELDLTATIDGIAADEFERIAGEAKAGCPVSKLLNAEITLTHRLN